MLKIDHFKKIDAHIHFNAGRKSLLTLAENYNFDLLTINTEVPNFPSIQKQRKLAQQSSSSREVQLHHAATFSTKNIFKNEWAEQTIQHIQQSIDEGACGIKFWKNIGMTIQRPDNSFLMPDDPELKPVFTYLENNQIPVLGHQGEPKNCWLPIEEMTVKSDQDYFGSHPKYHMYKNDEYPDYMEHVEARDNVLSRHPNLTFIGLHLASLEWSLDELSRRLDNHPNLAVDLAERIAHLYHHTAQDRNKVIDFFHTYQDRIIYGTDIIDDPAIPVSQVKKKLETRWNNHWSFFSTNQLLRSDQIEDTFKGLDLPTSILEKIYRTNALQWYAVK
ncbi:MAG: hydrolase [Balneolaceae bacterium]|nr:hydrolase [Balneolaceae bacterium]